MNKVNAQFYNGICCCVKHELGLVLWSLTLLLCCVRQCASVWQGKREIRLHLKHSNTMPTGSLNIMCFLAVYLLKQYSDFKWTAPLSSPFHTLSTHIWWAPSVRQWNLHSYRARETWLNIYSLMYYAAEAFKKDDWRIPIWNAAATSKREWEAN